MATLSTHEMIRRIDIIMHRLNLQIYIYDLSSRSVVGLPYLDVQKIKYNRSNRTWIYQGYNEDPRTGNISGQRSQTLTEVQRDNLLPIVLAKILKDNLAGMMEKDFLERLFA